MILAICIVVALLAGLAIGYLIATMRTDILLADMTDDELRTLASRVRERKGVSR